MSEFESFLKLMEDMMNQPDDGMHGKITVDIDGEEVEIDLDNPDLDTPPGFSVGLINPLDLLK